MFEAHTMHAKDQLICLLQLRDNRGTAPDL